ncbi:glycosyltransferase family protein [Iningainema tapete]|uniref:Glycosyltransferase family 4 protein n=1 Tax=Iningainema tapete BLCC-T55 TaxID=2748662 RepID=A0A8J6XL30_9CYAN|nr:glycosyltransferase [Iningainema tapete]MBD2774701.1 glycosyltransferase family 4 protein [Iningainema tapete BLCC-T55]
MGLIQITNKAFQLLKKRGLRALKQAVANKLYHVSLWDKYSEEALTLVSWLDFSASEVEDSRKVHLSFSGELKINSITWFIPDFTHPYYGGIYTILRFAQYFKEIKGVSNQFVIVGSISKNYASRAAEMIAQAFPSLADASVQQITSYKELIQIKPTDAAIASLWTTAYFLLRFNQTKRKFCFLQDYEPLFYPAGATYSQVEATYRFGFYGIANTPTIKEIYEQQYGGKANFFFPCVDIEVFSPIEPTKSNSSPYTVFFYGRPGNPRNGFELGAIALRKLKIRLGNQVRILSAGAAWNPKDFELEGVVENLGLLNYKQTADIYSSCDVGLVMMFTRHPSYLPFELMASGCLVVSNYNPATTWFLKEGQNCLLSESSATCLAEVLEKALLAHEERDKIVANALKEVQMFYTDWHKQIEKIYTYMCNPLVSEV